MPIYLLYLIAYIHNGIPIIILIIIIIIIIYCHDFNIPLGRPYHSILKWMEPGEVSN